LSLELQRSRLELQILSLELQRSPLKAERSCSELQVWTQYSVEWVSHLFLAMKIMGLALKSSKFAHRR
jgi:hypothetical protein